VRTSSVRLAFAALALSACQAVTAIDPPGTGASVVLVVTTGGALKKVYAFDRSELPSLAIGDGDQLYAKTFGCPLARIGLEAGAQALAETPSALPILPPGGRDFELSFVSGADNVWVSTSTLPLVARDALGRLPLDEGSPCRAIGARYEHTIITVPNDGRSDGGFLAALDDTRVLAGSMNGNLYLIDVVAKDARRLPQIEAQIGEDVAAAALAPDGAVWLITDNGRFFRGDVDSGFVASSTVSSPFVDQRRIAMAASRGDAPFELFVSTDEAGPTRRFARFDGVRWTGIAELATDRGNYLLPQVAWLGPGEAIAVGPLEQGEGVRRFKDGVASVEPIASSESISALLHPTLGELVGTYTGELLARENGAWVQIAQTQRGRFLRAMVPEGPGLLYTIAVDDTFGPDGFGQYYPAVGFCPGTEVLSDFAVTHLVAVGAAHYVALTRAGETAPFGISIVRRSQDARSCAD